MMNNEKYDVLPPIARGFSRKRKEGHHKCSVTQLHRKSRGKILTVNSGNSTSERSQLSHDSNPEDAIFSNNSGLENLQIQNSWVWDQTLVNSLHQKFQIIQDMFVKCEFTSFYL